MMEGNDKRRRLVFDGLYSGRIAYACRLLCTYYNSFC
jgi:hypothetical protein